jgi:uncharacterized Zn finger protein
MSTSLARKPGRESAAQKGRRYLAEGRLTVVEIGPAVVRAYCKGDGRMWRLGWWRGRWGCSCPALTDRCAHLLALRLVVLEPVAGEQPAPTLRRSA